MVNNRGCSKYVYGGLQCFNANVIRVTFTGTHFAWFKYTTANKHI